MKQGSSTMTMGKRVSSRSSSPGFDQTNLQHTINGCTSQRAQLAQLRPQQAATWRTSQEHHSQRIFGFEDTVRCHR
ncbi:hypothetical protein FRC03_005124 [Tulasnella sp. 419]|nr:hypothetical protein FRC03_005124 [Tulasnella sp. 419]